MKSHKLIKKNIMKFDILFINLFVIFAKY